MTNVFRYYACDGRCGRTIPIPADIAHEVLYPNGDPRPGFTFVCQHCDNWLQIVIEGAHRKYPPFWWKQKEQIQ
jgi:hypothetical protein